MYFSLLYLTVFFWGVSFVATKIVVESIPPIMAAVVRFLIAWIVLYILSSKSSYGKKKHIIFAGFWGITLYFLFENYALLFTTPTNAVLIISSIPIFNLIFLKIFRNFSIEKNHYIGSIIAFFGVAIVVFNGRFVLNLNPLGDILIFGAVIAWIMYTYNIEEIEKTIIKEKGGKTKKDTLAVTRDITLWGLIFLLPFGIIELIINPINLEKLQSNIIQIVIGLLYLGILCSSLGYFFWNKAIQNLGSRYTTNAIYVMPLVTSVAEAVFLKTYPNIWVISGGLLIIFGLMVSEKKKKQR